MTDLSPEQRLSTALGLPGPIWPEDFPAVLSTADCDYLWTAFRQPRLGQILRWRYGFETGQPLTQAEVGRRVGRVQPPPGPISREQVSQLERKALKQARYLLVRRWRNRSS